MATPTPSYNELKEELIERKVPYSNYESSLYIFDNKENREILKKHGYLKPEGPSTLLDFFTDNVTGKKMIEIYFMYDKSFDPANKI